MPAVRRLVLVGLLVARVAAAGEPAAPGLRLDQPSPRVWDAREREIAGIEASAGFGAAVLTIPAMLKAGEAIGKTSPNFIAAALPGLLLLAIIPPVAVTASEWGVGRGMRGRGVVRFHPAVWAAFGVNLIAIVAGAATGVSASDYQSVAMFTILDGMAMSLTTMLVLHYTQRRPPLAPVQPLPPAGTARALDGSLPRIQLPLLQGGFTTPVYAGRF